MKKRVLAMKLVPVSQWAKTFRTFHFSDLKKKPCDYVTTPFNAKSDPTFPENCGEMQKIFKK